MQIFALGMDVDIADPESGRSILESGEAGEMIVRKPFPSMDRSHVKTSTFSDILLRRHAVLLLG